MGNKFASMHVFDSASMIDEAELSKEYLNKLHDVEAEYSRRMRLFGGNGSESKMSEKIREILKQELLLMRKSVFFMRQNSFFSIFDNSFTFETIETAACTVSCVAPYPVVFTTMYDSDIFLLGLCVQGKCLTKHVSGSTKAIEGYGLKPVSANPDILCCFIDAWDKTDIEKFCKQRNARKAQRMLEKTMGVFFDVWQLNRNSAV